MRLLLTFLLIASTSALAGHRRVRHLTFSAKSFGARIALDSRAITGVANGASISTWSDLSGGGRNLSSVSPRQPTYVVAARAGQPVVRFGEVSGMTGVWNESLTQETVIMAFMLTASGSFSRFFTQTDGGSDYNSSGNYIPLLRNNSPSNFGGFVVGESFWSLHSNLGNFMVVSATHSGTAIINYLDGVAAATAASTLNKTISRFGVGVTALADANSGIEYASGDFCAIIAIARRLDPALRRRIEQAIAFSFKTKQ